MQAKGTHGHPERHAARPVSTRGHAPGITHSEGARTRLDAMLPDSEACELGPNGRICREQASGWSYEQGYKKR